MIRATAAVRALVLGVAFAAALTPVTCLGENSNQLPAAVGADCVRTDLALLDQTLREEALQEGSEAEDGGHGRPSQRRSSLDIASCINSGSALKYQKVS